MFDTQSYLSYTNLSHQIKLMKTHTITEGDCEYETKNDFMSLIVTCLVKKSTKLYSYPIETEKTNTKSRRGLTNTVIQTTLDTNELNSISFLFIRRVYSCV